MGITRTRALPIVALAVTIVGVAGGSGLAAAAGEPARIVFTSDFCGREPCGRAEIYTADPDGRHLRRLTRNTYDDDEPAWSPDHTHITFTSADYQIHTMRADGSARRRLTSLREGAFEPAWSPDGRRIVFRAAAGPLGPEDLYTVAAAGGTVRRLTHTREMESDPDWSPDGKKIVYSSDRGAWLSIWTLSLRTGARRQVTRGADSLEPSWSPDGRRIAFTRFVRDRWRLFVVSSDGSGLRGPLARDAGQPRWSPDGRRIVFVQNDRIAIINAAGGGRRYLTRPGSEFSAARQGDPDW